MIPKAFDSTFLTKPPTRSSTLSAIERTKAGYETTIAELISKIEQAVATYEIAQKTAADQTSCFEAHLSTANDTLRNQAAKIETLKEEIVNLSKQIETLARSVEPGMALIAQPSPPPNVVHTYERRFYEGMG